MPHKMSCLKRATSTPIIAVFSRSKIVALVFFGNYFYGLCLVAMSIESSLRQGFLLNEWHYYVVVFGATVVYYTRAYCTVGLGTTTDKRLLWYQKHRRLVQYSQRSFMMLIGCYVLVWLYVHQERFVDCPWHAWVLAFIFPMVAVLYYGIGDSYNLRRVGCLKPFAIGFVWAGIATVYPILFYGFTRGLVVLPNEAGIWLWLDNFLFVSTLSIMFDIKDYTYDYEHRLNTFVAIWGLRNTLFYLLIPLSLLSLVANSVYAVTHHFSGCQIALQSIPFVLLLQTIYVLRKKKPILYYLVVVDGLILLKAIIGILGVGCFGAYNHILLP